MTPPRKPGAAGAMIIRDLHDGWRVALVGEREVLRFKLPEHCTMADVDAIRDHLIRLVKEQELGPS